MSTTDSKLQAPFQDGFWRQRIYPDDDSTGPNQGYAMHSKILESCSLLSRLDFSRFINTMDDPSIAYFSLLREYASRSLQGNALQYERLYRAFVSQTLQDEKLSRCSVIEFGSNGSRSLTFSDFDQLKSYLEDSSPQMPMRRLFILEDLSVRFVCLLGSRLGIHPTIFANQYSTEDGSTTSAAITTLPSTSAQFTLDGLEYASINEDLDDQKRRFTLWYPIVMPRVSATQDPDPQVCPSWLKPDGRVGDRSAYPRFNVERTLRTPHMRDTWDAQGEVSRLSGLVTYWSREAPEGGWNCKWHLQTQHMILNLTLL